MSNEYNGNKPYTRAIIYREALLAMLQRQLNAGEVTKQFVDENSVLLQEQIDQFKALNEQHQIK